MHVSYRLKPYNVPFNMNIMTLKERPRIIIDGCCLFGEIVPSITPLNPELTVCMFFGTVVGIHLFVRVTSAILSVAICARDI